MARWHVSGVEKVRMGILVEAETAEQAQEIAEEIDMDQWADGGEYEFEIDHVSPWVDETK